MAAAITMQLLDLPRALDNTSRNLQIKPNSSSKSTAQLTASITLIHILQMISYPFICIHEDQFS